MPAKTWDVKRRGRGWVVQRVDARAAESLHPKRDDAIARGIDLAQRERGRLRVKNSAGRVEQRHDFTTQAEPEATRAIATTVNG